MGQLRGNIGVRSFDLFGHGDAQLILICSMISSKFGTENCTKRIGPAGVDIWATDHACKGPR